MIRATDIPDTKYPEDPDPCADIHVFIRIVDGKPVKSELAAYHDGLPLPKAVVRAFLRRLGIDLEDLF